jgi:hypothetical protein
MVDRGIKVQALGRGARVQSLAETAQSPRTDSAVAHRWAGRMDRVFQRLHIDRVVLVVNAGHRMCCRRYGHDHRPAMITKAHKPVILADRLGTFLGIQGTPERAGFAPSRADPRSFAVDLPSFLRMQLSVVWSGVHDRSQRVSQRARRRSTPNSSRSRNHLPQCRSARNSARRYRSSQSRSATARSPRSSSRIRSRNRYG